MDYNFQITFEIIGALLRGKKLDFSCGDGHKFTFHPPIDGIFLTKKQYYALKSCMTHGQSEIFYEIENDN